MTRFKSVGASSLGDSFTHWEFQRSVPPGFYSNRTDFIRTAIRNLLNSHEVSVQQSVTRSSSVLGTIIIDRRDLERIRDAKEKRSYSVIGMLVIRDDVPPELASAVIERIKVWGLLRASEGVKAALADRIR